ncbi:hypothetical protein [Actinomadura fibrosa]|uniref:DUF397 domain-containing protein n=1 Tax=Actinomadura fibrosa TaxID=111802 RepID=A0ABW2XTQ3_9ACTN|nr:hypothetical protein [Actinomadura fibrosa]
MIVKAAKMPVKAGERWCTFVERRTAMLYVGNDAASVNGRHMSAGR